MCNVGVTKVPSRKELKEALDLAFRHDSQAVLEPCVSDGVEVTCTVHDITGDELLEVNTDKHEHHHNILIALRIFLMQIHIIHTSSLKDLLDLLTNLGRTRLTVGRVKP